MPGLGDIASVVVTATGSPVTRVGFGTPLIADPCLAWGGSADRVRSYSKLADLVADGFVVTDGAYKAAAAMFAQRPSPPKIKIGRRANKPTQKFEITPTAQDNYKYQVAVNGVVASFTSGAGATLAQIIDGLKAAIDLLGVAVTTSNQGPNNFLRIVANVAGAWFGVACYDSVVPTKPHPYLSIVSNHVDPGVAADLDAIVGADADWYALLLTHHSTAEIAAIAAWVEANGPRIYLADTQNSDTYGNGGGDIFTTLKNTNYTRTAGFHHVDNGVFLACAIAGARLPTDPGSEDWMFTPGIGVVGITYSSNQQTNLDNKNGNYFYTVSGKSFAAKGKVAHGEYIDVIRFLDWLEINMAEDLLQLALDRAAEGKKIPFDDAGIGAVESVVRTRLKIGVRQGGLAPLPEPDVQVPLAADIAPADRAARRLTGITFSAQLAGSIHFMGVNGVVSF